jgi:hypothetical protein
LGGPSSAARCACGAVELLPKQERRHAGWPTQALRLSAANAGATYTPPPGATKAKPATSLRVEGAPAEHETDAGVGELETVPHRRSLKQHAGRASFAPLIAGVGL